MAGNLVNAFGKISLVDTQADNRELLLAILAELRIMNVHLESITDERVRLEDIEETL